MMSDDAPPATVSFDCPTVQVFHISARPCAQLPVRILSLFSQLGLLPRLVDLSRTSTRMALKIEQEGLGVDRANIIVEKVANMIDVEFASLVTIGATQKNDE